LDFFCHGIVVKLTSAAEFSPVSVLRGASAPKARQITSAAENIFFNVSND